MLEHKKNKFNSILPQYSETKLLNFLFAIPLAEIKDIS